MGILDFVKQGVQEMLVHRPDDKKSLVVYKWPEQTIPAYSQLTVDADEAAVFFRDGSLVGTMRTAGAGQRHTLSSQNIPFLGRLVDNVTGGNIFVTDLYFVTMRPLRGQRFGGQLDAMVDPVLGEMITPRVFGEFAWRVEDPEKFIVNYIGLGPTPSDEEVHSWFTGLLMNSVATVVAEVLAEEERSFLQIGALRQRFAEAFVARCPAMNDIGVAITQVGQFNINVDGDDRTRLVEAQGEMGQARRDAAKARIGIEQARAEAEQRQFELDQEFQNDARYVQGLAGGDYGKYAAGKAMIGAGEGMAKGGGEGGGAGGGMMAGAGLGAGFGMAQAFSGAMAPQQAAPAAAPAAAAPAAAAPAAAGGAKVTCPSCSAQVNPGKFCMECGSGLAPSPRFCPSCGTEGAPSAKFCANCGTGFPS